MRMINLIRRNDTSVLRNGVVVSRRGFVVVTGCLVGSCVMGGLTGCSADGGGVQDSLRITPALSGNSYDAALSAIQAEHPDAQLIAVRTSHDVVAGEECTWMYLFASEEVSSAYTVFSGENPTVAIYNTYELAEDEWNVIRSIDEVQLDADEAYAKLIEECGDMMDEVENCSVYLMTYVHEAEDPFEGTMKWFFDFNYPMTDGAVGGEGAPVKDEAPEETEESGDSGENGNTFGGADGAGGESMTPLSYYVDAVTGEVERVLVDDGNDDSLGALTNESGVVSSAEGQ